MEATVGRLQPTPEIEHCYLKLLNNKLNTIFTPIITVGLKKLEGVCLLNFEDVRLPKASSKAGNFFESMKAQLEELSAQFWLMIERIGMLFKSLFSTANEAADYQAELQLLKEQKFTTAKETVDFIINQGLSVADLSYLEDVTEEMLEKLFKENSKIKHLIVVSTNISRLPAECQRLQSLNCGFCHKLTELPDGLASLTKLDCRFCPALTKLPVGLTSLTELNCGFCLALVELPDALTSLTELNCRGCTALTKLPDGLMSLAKLNCTGCSKLNRLPGGLTKLVELNCKLCQFTQLPADLLASCQIVQ